MTEISRPVPGQRGNNLDADSVDDLLTAVLRLTAEVSALRERVSIWERVLESKGIPLTDTLRRVATTEYQYPLPARERDRLLRDALETLYTPDMPHSR